MPGEPIDNKRQGMAGIYRTDVWGGGDETLTETTRGVIIGVGGDLKVRLVDESATKVLPAVPAGLYPMWIDEIEATGTTAASITFLY